MHWQQFWQKSAKDFDAHVVLNRLRNICIKGSRALVGSSLGQPCRLPTGTSEAESAPPTQSQASLVPNDGMNFYLLDTLTPEVLLRSAKTYRKVSKGCDHWLAVDLLVPINVLAPIASAIDSAIIDMAWAHQMLCNLHPELLIAAGGGEDHSQDSEAVSVMGQNPTHPHGDLGTYP